MTSTKFLSSHGAAVNVRKTQRMAAKVMQLFNSPNKLLTTWRPVSPRNPVVFQPSIFFGGELLKFGSEYIVCRKNRWRGCKKTLYENIEERRCLRIPWCFKGLTIFLADDNLSNPRRCMVVRYNEALKPYNIILIYYICGIYYVYIYTYCIFVITIFTYVSKIYLFAYFLYYMVGTFDTNDWMPSDPIRKIILQDAPLLWRNCQL